MPYRPQTPQAARVRHCYRSAEILRSEAAHFEADGLCSIAERLRQHARTAEREAGLVLRGERVLQGDIRQ